MGVMFYIWIEVFLYILLPCKIQNCGCFNYLGGGVLSILPHSFLVISCCRSRSATPRLDVVLRAFLEV